MSFDIHIESLGDATKGHRFLTFGDYPRHVGIKGIQKLVNRFVMCLFTPVGTHLSDRDYGTDLAAALTGNTEHDALQDLATLAVSDAEDKIKELDVEYGPPDDERLSVVQLQDLHVDVTTRTVELKLRLRNVAGTTVLLLVPAIMGR